MSELLHNLPPQGNLKVFVWFYPTPGQKVGHFFRVNKRQHIWVVNVPGEETKQITDGQDWNDTDPRWSPDGTRIAFVSDRTGKLLDESHNTDVWVIPAAGGTLSKISDHDFEDESPRWSPDGRQILFTGKTAYHQFPKLYLADSAGGAASQLAVKDLDIIPTELTWSRSIKAARYTPSNGSSTTAPICSACVGQILKSSSGVLERLNCSGPSSMTAIWQLSRGAWRCRACNKLRYASGGGHCWFRELSRGCLRLL